MVQLVTQANQAPDSDLNSLQKMRAAMRQILTEMQSEAACSPQDVQTSEALMTHLFDGLCTLSLRCNPAAGDNAAGTTAHPVDHATSIYSQPLQAMYPLTPAQQLHQHQLQAAASPDQRFQPNHILNLLGAVPPMPGQTHGSLASRSLQCRWALRWRAR